MNTPQKGFTLVELIVVIVILGVLATIGFVSYSGYLGGARDGNRITQLKNINDSLNLYGATKTLPLPDDYITVTAGTTTVGYQGYAGENVLELINYISGGQDPKDDTYYTYYLTQDRKNIQLMALLEESEGLQTHNTIINPFTNPLIPQTYAADYSNRFPKVYGKKLGILVSNTPATKNTPAQEMTTTDIDLATSTIYTAYLDDTNNIESSTAGDLLTTIPNGSCNRIKQTGGSRGNGTYKINPDGTGDIEVYCDMERAGGGWYKFDTIFENDTERENWAIFLENNTSYTFSESTCTECGTYPQYIGDLQNGSIQQTSQFYCLWRLSKDYGISISNYNNITYTYQDTKKHSGRDGLWYYHTGGTAYIRSESELDFDIYEEILCR